MVLYDIFASSSSIIPSSLISTFIAFADALVESIDNQLKLNKQIRQEQMLLMKIRRIKIRYHRQIKIHFPVHNDSFTIMPSKHKHNKCKNETTWFKMSKYHIKKRPNPNMMRSIPINCVFEKCFFISAPLLVTYT